MLKVENIDVYGFEAAIRGMRNPMNSWAKSDSRWCSPGACNHKLVGTEPYIECDKYRDDYSYPIEGNEYCIGKNDMALMRKLFRGGTEHRKFMRMINVTMDITAPLYWWKEFDTYKVGTVANSCSTMHKIAEKEITIEDFSVEHMDEFSLDVMFNRIVPRLEANRKLFNAEGDKENWWQIIQLLPSSYNQKRTVQMNYEVCANIMRQRRNHKLDEWRTLCDEILQLPYFAEIIGENDDGSNA